MNPSVNGVFPKSITRKHMNIQYCSLLRDLAVRSENKALLQGFCGAIKRLKFNKNFRP